MNLKLFKTQTKNRKANERGAALLTSLLVSTLLLIVGGALILTTNIAQGLAIDSTAELQAYYSAEAGVNSTLNILRGNVESPGGVKATFRNVADNSTLSNWLTYGATINGVNVVGVNSAPEMGFTVEVTDPDAATTPPGKDPAKLLIHATGYGPKGAKKQMEVMVTRFIFDFSPQAMIMMVGDDDGATPQSTFAIGESEAKQYSGYDQTDPTKALPIFGVTHSADLTNTTTVINDSKPDTVTGVDKVTQFSNNQLPYFLQSADNARDFLNVLKERALTTERYFSANTTDLGTEANPQFTFIEGNATLTEGAGLLVVTGTLTSDGATGFKGIILVLGEGNFDRHGTGNSDLLGAIVVAKFEWPAPQDGQPHPFLAPTFHVDGGGTGLTGYDSRSVDRALSANGLRTLGVREY